MTSRETPKPARRGQLWRCPACRREFVKPNQWHSCATRGLDEHFKGRDPHLREVFDALVSKLRKIGPVKVDPVKTSINLTSGRHLGAVTVRGTYLRVGFYGAKRIVDPRIVHFESGAVRALRGARVRRRYRRPAHELARRGLRDAVLIA